jgi:hypothetical protein
LSLLFSVVFRSVCRGTHHRLAVDALRHLRGADAERWTDLFIHHHAAYLAGSKAPDDQFKDFRNHVLHVAENYWGGAPGEARRWYGRTVDALRRREWHEAVYSAGVLSHYVSDPFMPLHTAQSEEETKVHRALEWSVARSYGILQQIIELDLGGYPALETTRHDDWLERMIRTGAELAHEHYQALLDHYDLAQGLRDPVAGLDQESQNRIALCLGHAVTSFSRVLERALTEADVEPPVMETTLQGFLAALAVPIRTIVNHLYDLNERMAIEAIYDEMQRTGKVVKNLPADDREIRHLHAEEVLRVSLHHLDQQPAKATGTLHGSGATARHHRNRLIATPVLLPATNQSAAWRSAHERTVQKLGNRPVGASTALVRAAEVKQIATPSYPLSKLPVRPVPLVAPPKLATKSANPPQQPLPEPHKPAPPKVQPPLPAAPKLRFHLQRNSPVVDAPTIGPKLASRLEQARIVTVGDLLDANADALTAKLNQRHITADTVRTWQQEATLVCRIPELRGHDAQLLVAAGVTEPQQVATYSPETLLELVLPIATSPAGKQILRNQPAPNQEEVAGWITRASGARQLQAA